VKICTSALLISLAAISVAPAYAKWPEDKNVTIVINFSAGGGLDLVGRIIAQKLSEKFPKTSFIVENRTGASGNIGQAYVGKAAPDGYTFLMSAPGPAANNALTFKSLSYDPIKDFDGVAQLTTDTLGVIVNKKGNPQLQTVKSFLEYAKANKGKLNVGMPGIGSYAHMISLGIQEQLSTEFNLVPYRGAPDLASDLLSGNIDAFVNFTGPHTSQLEAGEFVALAVMRDDRSVFLPNVPTLKESGLNFSASPWTIMQAPKGVSREIINEMSIAVNEILKSPDVVKRILDAKIQPAPSTPEVADALVRGEQEKWRAIVKKYNITNE
jgi:tripartite-type tricarboxylate transporter receptor subunit TctC